MKNKSLLLIIVGLIFLGLILSLIFYFDASTKYVIVLCIGGLVIGLLNILMKAFLVPPQWAFNHRFGIEGLLFMIPLLLLTSLVGDYGLSLKSITVDLIFGGVIGYCLMGYFYKSNYNKVIKKITYYNLNGDCQTLTDLASYKENNTTVLGKLILTNKQKLIFIHVDLDMPIYEIDLFEQKQSIRMKSTFGLPNGIIINENLQLSLSYPKLWIKKINTA